MLPYMMRSESDCGPAALSAITGLPYERIIRAWPGGWRDGDRGRLGSPNDTPWDHFSLLQSLGIPWRIVPLAEILAGRIPNDKTMILLHRPGNLLRATLEQHWGVIQGVDAEGVRVHMGSGQCRLFDKEQITDAYADGWPACAYVVGEGKTYLPWRMRLVAALTGKFI